MSDTIRADRTEPAERAFTYRPRCCDGAPHDHAPLYSYGLRDAKLAQISPRAAARPE